MEKFRIGNDLTVFWAILDDDSQPYDLTGRTVKIFLTHPRGRMEITQDVNIQGNVISWLFRGRQQRYLGVYKLTVEIFSSPSTRVLRRDIDQAFSLVSATLYVEESNGRPQINETGKLTLSTILEVYQIMPIVPQIGPNSNWWVDGVDTGKPSTGMSAYEFAKENGYTGTEEEYAAECAAVPTLNEESRVATAAASEAADNADRAAGEARRSATVANSASATATNAAQAANTAAKAANDAATRAEEAIAEFGPAIADKADLENGKIIASQLPDYILGQVMFGGLIYSDGTITASSNFKSKYGNDTNISASEASKYNGVYFIVTGEAVNVTIAGVSQVSTGDWIISTGSSWKKIDNSDAVTSVAGLVGNVNASSLAAVLADLSDENALARKRELDQYVTEVELGDFEADRVDAKLIKKQDILVSGQNIKTINGESVLGEGNILIEGGSNAHSDWFENDPSTEAYIYNRTHYFESLDHVLIDITNIAEGDVIASGYGHDENIMLSRSGRENVYSRVKEGKSILLPAFGPDVYAHWEKQEDETYGLIAENGYGVSNVITISRLAVVKLPEVYLPHDTDDKVDTILKDGYLYSNGEKVDMRFTRSLIPVGTSIPANANLNSKTYLKIGKYYCRLNVDAKTITNCPTSEAFSMEVFNPLGTNVDDEDTEDYTYRLRVLTAYKTGVQYIQYCNTSGTAGSWTYNGWFVVPRTSFSLASSKNGGTAAKGASNRGVYIDSTGTFQQMGYTVAKSVPSNAVFTDTNTKVTSVGNHYAPAEDEEEQITAPEGEVVTGVKRDAAGHVVGVVSAPYSGGNDSYDDTELRQEIALRNVGAVEIDGDLEAPDAPSGGYDDTQVKADIAALQNGKQDNINDLATIRSGAALGATALQSIPLEYATKNDVSNAIANAITNVLNAAF